MSAIRSGIATHALADLRLAALATGEPDIHVPVLVRLNPWLIAHGRLAHHRSCFNRRVDFIAGAVEETGIDEHHPVRSGTDRGLQVDRRAALLVHDADLERKAWHQQRLSTCANNSSANATSAGPCIFGLTI